MKERMEKGFSLVLGALLVISMLYVARGAAVLVNGRNVENTEDISQSQICVVIDAGHGSGNLRKVAKGK